MKGQWYNLHGNKCNLSKDNRSVCKRNPTRKGHEMDNIKQEFHTIDEYILLYPEEVQDKLRLIRKVIKEAAPEAVEKISWQMPTFYLE